jgi:hypothetical protein
METNVIGYNGNMYTRLSLWRQLTLLKKHIKSNKDNNIEGNRRLYDKLFEEYTKQHQDY